MNLEKKEIQRDLTQKIREKGWSEDIQDEYNKFVSSVKQREQEFYENEVKVKEEGKWKATDISGVSHEGDESIISGYKAAFGDIPTLKSAQPEEPEHDMDFPVDAANYDAWEEYRMIYGDALSKGRKYWILQSMPDWWFLQKNKEQAEDFDGISFNDPTRPNMDLSIFAHLEQEKFKESRRIKHNKNQKYNYNIRI